MPSLLRRSLSLLRAPVNEVAFALRSRLRWRRGLPARVDESKQDLFGWLEASVRAAAVQRAAELEREFDLTALRSASSRLVYAENVALLDRLDDLTAGIELPIAGAEVQAVDVGCGSFQYATALQRWLSRRGAGSLRGVRLRGIEIDGFGVYRDGHSRADHAASHAALAGAGVTFEVADFARLAVPPQDVVTMFFPFLNAFTALQWGAPLSHLRPRRCLDRAVAALRPDGALVVVNQTEVEFERLRYLLADRPVTLARRIGFGSDLVPYGDRTQRRIGSLWRRNALPAAAKSR